VSRRPKTTPDHPELGLPEVRKLWQTGDLFSDHYLKARVRHNAWWPGDAEAKPVWEFCKALYDRRYVACAKNNEAFTRQELLDKILEKLGFGWTDNLAQPETKQALEPDYIVFASEAEKEAVINQDSAQRYRAAIAILEAKKLNHPLSQISKTQQRYPHQQIRDYLNEAQVLTWGILTNGNEWRLYCRDTKPSHFFAINFELAIQSLDNFKFFLALFSPAAFVRDEQGKCRLDHVRDSALAAQSELEEDLRQRVFAIVEILANGFAGRAENGITDADLPQLYDICLIFLYRLLFILYAEGRQLLPVEPKSRKYYKELSLARLVVPLKTFEHDSHTRTRLHEDIRELCHLINGTDEKKNAEFKVPRYNGGLFAPERHPLLEKWRVCDAVLADVLRGLMFNPQPERDKPALPIETVDFGDLRVQQLGSIYEGLLEHHFVREGDRLALKTDKAERKATGTYYTPDYIVKYIVEQTVAPLLAEIEQRDEVKKAHAAGIKDNSFARAALALNILDPAMGSGHFLVEATTSLADEVAAHPTTQPLGENSKDEDEIAHWRRRVVEACIYGVDLNPLAVELAKLSLWLTTIATDQPLNFLDHHLRCGNSLVGARLEDLGHVPERNRIEEGGFQFTWKSTDTLQAALKKAVGTVRKMEETSSDTVLDVKNKEKIWLDSVRPALRPFRSVANLWTACFFGNDLRQPDYEALLDLLASDPNKGHPWKNAAEFQEIAMQAVKKGAIKLAGRTFDKNQIKTLCAFLIRAEQTARERRFFHWELEFPEVFFNDDGSPRKSPGFDAVMGNPPWGAEMTAEEKEFYRLLGTDTSTPNTFIYFIRQGELLTTSKRFAGFVVPDSVLVKDYQQTRRMLLHENTLARIAYLEGAFKGVNHDSTVILFARGKVSELELRVGIVPHGETAIEKNLSPIHREIFDSPELEYRFNLNLNPQNEMLYRRLSQFEKVGDVGEFHEGIHTGNVRDKLFYRSKPTHSVSTSVKPCLIGSSYGDEFGRYFCIPHGNWTIYDASVIAKEVGEYASLRDEKIFLGEKLYVTRTGDDFYSFYDDRHYASNNLFSFKLNPKKTKLNYLFVLTVLNSRFAQRYNRLYLAPRFGDLFTETKILHLALLPLPCIEFTTPAKKRAAQIAEGEELYEKSVADGVAADALRFIEANLKGGRADVVHDLLAFLAGRMMAMNAEMRTSAKQFLTDLKDFHGIEAHALNPKTKLDEFWKLEAADMFAHLRKNTKLLAGKNVRLTEDAEEKIRARFMKSKSALLPIEAQIAFTDTLIDEIVYRLYALTPEEIQIVSGR